MSFYTSFNYYINVFIGDTDNLYFFSLFFFLISLAYVSISVSVFKELILDYKA